MKKRLFLAILPALMALTACSGVAPKSKNNIFVEDTLAHEEIFGEVASQPEQLKIRNPLRENDPEPEVLSVSNIGVQYKPVENNQYALRFVVAISSLNVEAVWTRNICQTNGTRRKTESNQVSCSVAYKALSSTGGVEVPSSLGDQYKGFVVYTLRNVPASDIDSYLFGYLTITNGSSTAKTVARIARVGGGNTFTINQDSVNGVFIQGQVNGSSNPVMLNDTATGNNIAQKENMSFRAGDSFGVFKYESGANEHFQCFGYGQIKGGTEFAGQVSSNHYTQIYLAGTYSLFLNTSNELYLAGVDVKTTLYFKPNDWSSAGNPWYALWNFKEGVSGKWITLTQIGSTGIYESDEEIDVLTYPSAIFCRMNPSYQSPDWNSEAQNDHVWNQTADLSILLNYNMFQITGKPSYVSGEWTTYNA